MSLETYTGPAPSAMRIPISRHRVIEDLQFAWELTEGEGFLQGVADQEVEFRAPTVPGLTRLQVTVSQRGITVAAEALITVTDSFESAISPIVAHTRGLPGYTFERAAGELWRCRFDSERKLIVVNSGRGDFVFATRHRALQLRYLVRLYGKELVLKNFAGLPADQLLERMIELSLYTEERSSNRDDLSAAGFRGANGPVWKITPGRIQDSRMDYGVANCLVCGSGI